MRPVKPGLALLALSAFAFCAGCGEDEPPRGGAERQHAVTPEPADEADETPPSQPGAPVEPAPPSAATPPGPAPLRSVVHRLIDRLTEDAITPPLEGRPPLRCLQRQPGPPVPSPYSKLPETLRPFHVHATLRAEKQRRDIRDSFVFEGPRTFAYSLELPPEPRLEFAYRVMTCAGPPAAAQLRVTVTPASGEPWERTIPLATRERPPRSRPWWEISIPLEGAAQGSSGKPVRLTVAFETPEDEDGTTGGRTPVIVWAEPLVTGRVRPDAPEQDVNVLFIIIDALRSDLVGPGRKVEPPLAPNMEALFRKGTGFSYAFSAANQTRPSTLAIFTSQTPSLGGFFSVPWIIKPKQREAFYESDPPLLTRAVREAGWRVSTVGHNRFLFASHPMGIEHGFDRTYDDRNRVHDTPLLADEAIRYIEAHREDRWFLYFNLVGPHLPYTAPEEYRQRIKTLYPRKRPRHLHKNYMAEIPYTDDHLARVLSAVEAAGLSERTLIVLMADHGEMFHPAHKCWSKRFQQNCTSNHALTLYDEEIHVPLAFVLPGRVKAGHVVHEQTSLLNVAPTVLDLLGLPEQPRHIGRSLVPELLGADGRAEPVYAEGRRSSALRWQGLKLHVHHRRDDANPKSRTGGRKERRPLVELFDLADDPWETRNLALLGDPRVATMRAELTRVRTELASRMSTVERAKMVSARSGDEATNVLMLETDGHEHALEGTIVARQGRVACGPVKGSGSCAAEAPDRIAVRLDVRDAASRVVFKTTPWAAPLHLDLQVDGHAVPPERLHLGPYGLRLLRKGEALDTPDHLALAGGLHPPRVKPKSGTRVFLWRNPGRVVKGAAGEPPKVEAVPLGPESMEGEPDQDDLTPELRKALKEMGYTQ